MKQKRNKSGVLFWDTEYKTGNHLALSTKPSEDFVKFLRFLEREEGKRNLNPTMSAIDIGCGNGRNLVYLKETYGMRGIGIDISASAIAQAKKAHAGTQLSFTVGSIADPLPAPDASQILAIDAMSSHVLSSSEREKLFEEIVRVLRPHGWYFFKTFLLDSDPHAKRLLKEHPGKEAGSYIHPVIGVAEYVYSEEDILAFVEKYFKVRKVLTSHGHLRKGTALKRRSISIYAQKV